MAKLEAATKRLDRYIRIRMQAANTPGMSVALTDRKELLHLAAYGFADLAGRVPVTEDTLFEIGSISKSFTSVVMMQLQEEGIVDLHRPVVHYLPWFKVQSEYEPITLHHLMSHSAGIIRGMEFTGEARYEVWALRETAATAPPGTYYHYSNVGYKALGIILEDILRKPYGDIIQERILDPLGMTRTDPITTHETRKRLAVGYESFYDDRPPPRERPLAPATWLEYRWGDGSVSSTAADMATYLRMYLNRGRVPDNNLLSEESVDLMMEPIIDAIEEGRASYYGYGLDVEESDGRKIIGHGGGMVGYYAHVLADIHEGLGVVVLTNGPGSKTDVIARYALDLLHTVFCGGDFPPPPRGDPSIVGDANDYVGSYKRPPNRISFPNAQPNENTKEGIFRIEAHDSQLYLQIGDKRLELEGRGPDQFHVNHPEFAHSLLLFGRDRGEVVEAYCGPDWYVNERYEGPGEFPHPPEWEAYPGHYRSHNPWDTNFRVVLQKAKLRLIYPSGEEEPLIPCGDGGFRVGDGEVCPERIRFDVIVDNQALRANFSCGEYYRSSKY